MDGPRAPWRPADSRPQRTPPAAHAAPCTRGAAALRRMQSGRRPGCHSHARAGRPSPTSIAHRGDNEVAPRPATGVLTGTLPSACLFRKMTIRVPATRLLYFAATASSCAMLRRLCGYAGLHPSPVLARPPSTALQAALGEALGEASDDEALRPSLNSKCRPGLGPLASLRASVPLRRQGLGFSRRPAPPRPLALDRPLRSYRDGVSPRPAPASPSHA